MFTHYALHADDACCWYWWRGVTSCIHFERCCIQRSKVTLCIFFFSTRLFLTPCRMCCELNAPVIIWIISHIASVILWRGRRCPSSNENECKANEKRTIWKSNKNVWKKKTPEKNKPYSYWIATASWGF